VGDQGGRVGGREAKGGGWCVCVGWGGGGGVNAGPVSCSKDGLPLAAAWLLAPRPTLVAFRASSTRSFFSFSSVSVWAPTCKGGRAGGESWGWHPPPALLAPHGQSFSRLGQERPCTSGSPTRTWMMATPPLSQAVPPHTHLDDGHAAAEPSNALVQLLLLVLLLGRLHQVADLAHAHRHLVLGAAVAHNGARLLPDHHLRSRVGMRG
jgi:hypothetical protein